VKIRAKAHRRSRRHFGASDRPSDLFRSTACAQKYYLPLLEPVLVGLPSEQAFGEARTGFAPSTLGRSSSSSRLHLWAEGAAALDDRLADLSGDLVEGRARDDGGGVLLRPDVDPMPFDGS